MYVLHSSLLGIGNHSIIRNYTISSHIMGRLDDIQTALNSLKKIRKKLKYIFMTILGLAELFKT